MNQNAGKKQTIWGKPQLALQVTWPNHSPATHRGSDRSLCALQVLCADWLEATSQMHMTFSSPSDRNRTLTHLKLSNISQIGLPSTSKCTGIHWVTTYTVAWIGDMTWFCLDFQALHRRCRKAKLTCENQRVMALYLLPTVLWFRRNWTELTTFSIGWTHPI